MSIILILPVAISTERSTDRPCTLDTCSIATSLATSFTHQSSICVIRRMAFQNLGFIGQMSCTPLPATLYNLASQNSGLALNDGHAEREYFFFNLIVFESRVFIEN